MLVLLLSTPANCTPSRTRIETGRGPLAGE